MSALKQVLIVTNAMTNDEMDKIKDAFTPAYAPKLNVKINLVHVIPPLPTCYFNIPAMNMLIEKYYTEARSSLEQMGQQLNVDINRQWLISGKVRTEVLRLAHKLNDCFILAGAKQIKELQRSLFFKNINQADVVKTIYQFNHLKPQ